ncbi:PP2C family protein-serine/threonine phosphatase [Peterkaempfera griseoplana]|uniref:PP2C family protein-serine/threonine phosphatase n=1 Tax=Peterkaempfera griseoplana TaxID=66896 RepID=UPI0006E29359|nr:PP2C family protein-serine/threonine phosphatase [Peterkaempfera griseoplana]
MPSGRWARRLPALLLLFAALIDLTTPRTVSAAALYAASVLTAAPLLSLRATVLTGVVAVLVDWVMFQYFGYGRSAIVFSELTMVATVTGVAVLLNHLLHAQETRLRSVRGIAAAVQRAVLPEPPARIGPLCLAARYAAAQEDAQIGGDLYAVQNTPYGVRCVIGDVRGKGVESVYAVTVALGAFREAAQQEPCLSRVAERLDEALTREAEQAGGVIAAEGFVTALLAEFPLPGDEARLVNRGHPAPVLFLDGAVSYVAPDRPALPLGMATLQTGGNPVDTVAFPEGAGLLLCTDGLTEARDEAGVFYDPVERLTGQPPLGPEALLDAVLVDVRRHTGGRRTDDLALLAISRLSGGEGVPGGRRTGSRRAPGPSAG